MDLKIESKENYLLVTLEGRVSLYEAITVYTRACDVTAQRGFSKILVDGSSADGKLSIFQRYELGRTMAQYCQSRFMSPKVATVGTPPTIDGFGALVARNRGMVAETFPDLQTAQAWLNQI